MNTEKIKTNYVSTLPELQAQVRQWRNAGQTIALVPTMGALHNGHLLLAQTGKLHCDRLITSIFVNPSQFAPQEDLTTYPRTFDLDLEKLAGVDCDLIWAPTTEIMYPEGFATTIIPKGAAEELETNFRPQFFAGVATVCCKLFAQVLPDIAVFGEKDYQQLCVIRQLVRDLNLPIKIVSCETVRETDGLAMSSRNVYLSQCERKIAASMNTILNEAGRAFRRATPVNEVCQTAVNALLKAGFGSVDYVELRNAETLRPVSDDTNIPCRLLAAAWLGKTRLIDNIPC